MHLFSEHLRTRHILSEADPRLKLVVAFGSVIMILSYKGFLFPLIILAGSVVLCVKMRVPVREFILRFLEPAFIVCMLVVIKFFFSGHDPLFTIHAAGLEITGHRDSLFEGLHIACRILGAVSVISALGFATPFTELLSGLAWMRIPKGLIEILMFAYRYIFLLFEDAMVIYNSQKNRLGYSSLRRSMSSFGVLAGALTLKAFEQSQNTTVAMVQRGYDGTIPALKQKRFKPSEVSAAMLILILMGVLWKTA